MAPTPATTAGNQVNLPFSYHYYRSKGTSPPHQPETRSHMTCESPFVRSQTGKAQVVPFPFPYYYNYTHRRNRKERRIQSLQPIFIDDNGTPATWTLVLSSSKPLTGRTGHQLRDASATGTTGDTPWTYRNLSHYRTRTRLMTTCLVGHPSIEATTPA